MSKEIIIPVEIGGVKFKNPFYVASGPTTKTIKQLLRIEQTGWAAASIKLTIDPAPYVNRVPRYGLFNGTDALAFTAEKRLKFEQGLKLVENSRKQLKELILLANITYAGDKGLEGWVNMARRFEEVGAHIIELNMCCPNMSYNIELTSGDSGASDIRTGASLGQQEEAIAAIVKEIKKAVRIPVFVKLTPEGGRIAQISKILYDAGADAVGGTANRLGIPPIDLERPEKAVYHLQDEISMSCYSGGWLKPLALRDTYEMRKVNGPGPRIMATGGVRNYKDAIEMVMCGADLIGICAETLISGYDFIRGEIVKFKSWMDEHGYNDFMEVRDKIVSEVKTAPELTLYKGFAKIKQPDLSAPCKSACPMHVPAQAYVKKVSKKEYREAFDIINGAAPLQNICGFVCDHKCEDECTRGVNGKPVRIRDIKRFVLDYGKNQGWRTELKAAEKNGKKAAVIGSGPAGISNAFYLAKAGYDVTIFERESELGGALRYGIPSFCLPKSIVEDEINMLEDMGIGFKTNHELGKDITIDSLKNDSYDIIFIATGAEPLQVPDIQGIMNASDFLRRVNQSEKVAVGDTVVAEGSGYSAVDSARAAVRLGANKVYCIMENMKVETLAVKEMMEAARVEGVRFIDNASYVSAASKDGHVSTVKLYNTSLSDLGENAAFFLPCDTVILSSNQGSNRVISVNNDDLSTDISGVYAGGGAIGTSTVIGSVADGRKAAALMDKYIFGEKAVIQYPVDAPVVDKQAVLKRTGYYIDCKGANIEIYGGQERINNFDTYERVMTEEEAVEDASRCLTCGCGEGCSLCRTICCDFSISIDKVDTLKINNFTCVACGMCFNRCPNKNIEMVNTGEKV